MSFKENINYLGKNYKKEIYKIILFNLVCFTGIICIIIFYYNLMIIIAIALATVTGNYLLVNNISSARKNLENKRDEEFITVITYFQTFINNHYNIYISFQKCLEFTSAWMSEQIKALLFDIDENKSVEPYLTFARKFTKTYVETVMLSIYQMVDEGENNAHFQRFNILFNQISASNKLETIQSKHKALDSMTMFPLIGAGLITLLLTFGIIQIIGDLTNVI